MENLVIHQVVPHYGDVRVVLADGVGQRHYVGVPASGDGGDRYLFVEIDRVTMLELQRGEIGLYSILTERAIGLVFETGDYALLTQDAVQHAAIS